MIRLTSQTSKTSLYKASGPNARIGVSFSGPVVLENWEDLQLNHSSVNVAGQDVECKEIISNELQAKVKNLVNHIPKIASHQPRFLQNVQKASTGESDSDDEDAPLDQEILPAFDEQSVVMIQMHSNIMCREWQRVVNASYSNGPGKYFADSFAKFLLTVFPDDQNPYEPRHSTTSGGKGEFGDTQAGSMSVAYVYNKRNKRTHAAGEQETQTNFKIFSILPYAQPVLH